MKLSNKEIKILKNKRIKIEHINAKLKNYKKNTIRYDKKNKKLFKYYLFIFNFIKFRLKNIFILFNL
jgi:hypothetical protein